MTEDADGPADQQPELTLELLAAFDAGALAADEDASVRDRIADDPRAQRALAALAATRADLAHAPVTPTPLPPSVAAATDATLETIRREQLDTTSSRLDSLSRARDARRRRALAVASAAAVLVAVVTLVVAVVTTTGSTDDQPSRAQPSGADTGLSPAPAPVAELLAAVGRTDPLLGSPNDPKSRLRRCLRANDVPESTAVVGSGPLDAGARVVVLLSTGVAGRFDALVVGADCDAGRPAFVSRTVIGAPGR